MPQVMPYRLRAPYAAWRRSIFFLLSVGATVLAARRMTDILGSDGLSAAETAVVILFAVNFLWIAVSFFAAVAGLWLVLTGRDALSLQKHVTPQMPQGALLGRTAVLFPVYNEDPERVFAGIAATYDSLKATGHGDSFDFFVLSDTRDPQARARELLAFLSARDRLQAHAKLFYRHREHNTEKKPGNIADFCERWGNAYDYMLICDADSVMAGETMVKMADLMDRHPRTALIQSPPVPTGCGSTFARIQQFISRLHGGTMSAGLAFWTMGSGNYWGHNALIRMQAFTDHCGLPVLSGKPPFGGPVMSHDFIEAAFLRRAGYEVWLVPDLEGSWEELPSNVIAYAARDKRWCRGNLQHIRFLTARGFKPLSRLHLFMGIMSYVSSPLWFLLLIASTLTAYETSVLGQAFFIDPYRLFPVWPISRTREMMYLIMVTLGMLIVPKFCSAGIAAACRQRAASYGGRAVLTMSMLGELVFSALLAPAMMIFHTRFVLGAFDTSATSWEAQARGDASVGWRNAAQAQTGTLLLGIIWGSISYTVSPAFFLWMLPVLSGLVLAIPLTVYTSRVGRRHLFLTPEETAPPTELRLLHEHLRKNFLLDNGADPLQQIIDDPRAESLRRAAAPARTLSEDRAAELLLIDGKRRRLGAAALSRDEQLKLLDAPVTLPINAGNNRGSSDG